MTPAVENVLQPELRLKNCEPTMTYLDESSQLRAYEGFMVYVGLEIMNL